MREDESEGMTVSAGSDALPIGSTDPGSSGDLVISVTAEGMLVDGDPKAVAS